MRLFPAGAASSRFAERQQPQPDFRSKRGFGLPSFRRHQSHDGKPHQPRLTAVAPYGHVPAPAGTGNAECNRHFPTRPMTHLQTANNYPDMAALETIQQFAMLNRITLSDAGQTPYTGNSYPINVSYAPDQVISGVATPLVSCADCQGLDFGDQGGDNEALVTGIVKANMPGFYVFSAPWETTRALLANINKLEGYNLSLPASYISPNYIYAISIAPLGRAHLVTYNSNVVPP